MGVRGVGWGLGGVCGGIADFVCERLYYYPAFYHSLWSVTLEKVGYARRVVFWGVVCGSGVCVFVCVDS